MRTAQEEVVKAKDLGKSYGKLEAVRRISFSIHRSEVFGFLGPNGAGKTTTMKMIHCALPRTSGELKVLGEEAHIRNRRLKQRIGVVPQENSLDPDVTVEENLWIYGKYYSLPKELLRVRMEKLLHDFSLQDRRKSSIRKLSGGQQRRLVIARGLICDPELLVLDEPTTGLDPVARHLIWERIKELKAQGKTMILTTHYMEEASRLCDRIALMDEGKILYIGDPKQVVAEQLGEIALKVSAEKQAIDRVEAFLRQKNVRFCRFDHSLFIFPKALSLIPEIKESFRFREWSEMPANLEHLFLFLTGHKLA